MPPFLISTSSSAAFLVGSLKLLFMYHRAHKPCIHFVCVKEAVTQIISFHYLHFSISNWVCYCCINKREIVDEMKTNLSVFDKSMLERS